MDPLIARKSSMGSLALLVLPACANLPGGRGWGEDATISPGWARIAESARSNALDPWTWAPIAGAAVLSIDDWDEEISDWARDEQPVFGSTGAAIDAANEFRHVLYLSWLASMAATQSGDSVGGWPLNKAKGVAVEFVANLGAQGLTSYLKNAVGRERPNESNDRSFPSGHTTSAFSYAHLASMNLDSTGLPEGLRWPVRAGLYTLAIGTGWSRVESGDHFPVDVLFAAGATNFVTGFVHDAFLGLDSPVSIEAGSAPDGSGITLGVAWRY
jgi:membrane-associated phospholipid phosphatase